MKDILIKTPIHFKISGIILFLAIFVTQNFQAQEKITDRFDFSVAYGIGYNNRWGRDFGGIPDYKNLNLEEFPKIIGVFELNFLYRLKENRFIGLNYSKLNYSNTLNESRYFQFQDVMVILDNYKNLHTYQYFGIQFRQEFLPMFHFGVGLNYYVHQFNYLSLETKYGTTSFIGEDWKQRLDDLGLSASIDYYFPIKSYVQIGLRTKGFLTMMGFEAITLTPVLKFSF